MSILDFLFPLRAAKGLAKGSTAECIFKESARGKKQGRGMDHSVDGNLPRRNVFVHGRVLQRKVGQGRILKTIFVSDHRKSALEMKLKSCSKNFEFEAMKSVELGRRKGKLK